MSPTSPNHQLSSVARRLAGLTEERDALILQCRATGMSLRRIADLAGMTHVGVWRVIERAREADTDGE